MKACVVIAAFVFLLSDSPYRALSADDEPVDDAVKRDLAWLQGKWETTVRTRDGRIQNVQTINGTTSTVERFDENGELLHKHTAQFKLRVTDEVRIFTFFDLEVTAGPRKGLKFKGPLSFVYVPQRDSWFEARGLMINQKDGEPRFMVWKRVAEKKVAANTELLR